MTNKTEIDSQPVRLGLIGAGNFARNLHIPNIVRIPECSLTAVSDLQEDLLKHLKDQYQTEYVSTDYKKLLDDPGIDAVVIAVRDDLQAPIATQALEKGKHVYVEKPLAETPDAIAPVLQSLETSGKKLAVGFNRRFAPMYLKAKQVLDRDGGPKNIYLRMTDDAWRWAKGYPPGYLIKHDVCHFFDLLRWLTSAEIESIYCISSRPDDDVMSVKMSNGSVASVVQSGHGTMDMPKERFEAVSERGSVVGDDFVELKTYGFIDFEHQYKFAGHSNPDRHFMHKYLYRNLGLKGLQALRRETWELRQRVEKNIDMNVPDAEEIRKYVEMTIPNFMRDQGWMDSMRRFVQSIASGDSTHHAGAEDALKAAQAAQAAVDSRDQGVVITIAS